MRLIDSDALLKSHCSALDDLDGECESCEACLKPPYGCCCLEVKGEDIYYAPTIDAIPVEWLREWQDEVGTMNEWWPIIQRIITVWHEEQEAR